MCPRKKECKKLKCSESFISIIVTAYNIEKYLPSCLDSILAQTYSNFELILVDDGSTDSSAEICDKYALKDLRIRVVHQENLGVSDSWNKAIGMAKGDYIGFVDGDDLIHPRMYEILSEAIRDMQGSVAFCDFRTIAEDETVESYQKKINKNEWSSSWRESSKEYEMVKILHEFSAASIWKGLYKSSLIKPYRFESGRKAQDFLWSTYIVLNADRIVRVEFPLYLYRIRIGSESFIARNEKMIDHLYIRLQLLDYLKKHAPKWVVPFTVELFSICIQITNKINMIKDNNQKDNCREAINLALSWFSEISVRDILRDPYTQKPRKTIALVGKISYPLSCILKRNLLKIVNR